MSPIESDPIRGATTSDLIDELVRRGELAPTKVRGCPEIDTQIIEKIGETPGMSPHSIGNALIVGYSTTYTKTRISFLVATGKIRAVTDSAGRSKLYPTEPAIEARS